jgi:hypothetical protein
MPPAHTPNPAAFDVGNPHLEPVECSATATVLTPPGGGPQFLMYTVRTTSASLTVFLDRDQAVIWRDLLDAKITKMTSLVTGQPMPMPGPPGPPMPGSVPLPFPAYPNGDPHRGRM